MMSQSNAGIYRTHEDHPVVSGEIFSAGGTQSEQF